MGIPFNVIVIYAALAIWFVLLIGGLKKQSFQWFLLFGIAILLYLNVSYFVRGVPESIASFVGLYDVLDNLGVDPNVGAAALSTCANNACTSWGDTYLTHPSWGVAFYDRFANGADSRSNLLLGHIALNTIAFVLVHIQLMWPGTGLNPKRHKVIGRVAFAAITVGTICAVWLASQHSVVPEYGGALAMFGFWFMSACVYTCAVMGLMMILRGDVAAHRVWMIRFAGAMWGAFWLFRVMLFVLGPLLRNFDTATILICIWFSAPLGIFIAEAFRRKLDAAARVGAHTQMTSS